MRGGVVAAGAVVNGCRYRWTESRWGRALLSRPQAGAMTARNDSQDTLTGMSRYR